MSDIVEQRVRCFRRADGQTIEGCDRIRFRSHGTCELVYRDDTFEVLPMHIAEAEAAVRRGIWVEVNDSPVQAMPDDPAAEIERLRARVAELEAAAKELADGWTNKHVVNTDLDRRVVNMILAWDRPRYEAKIAESARAANQSDEEIERLRARVAELEADRDRSRIDVEQACRLLRLWAQDRQRASGKWTGQEQAAVDCAIRLEESARAANGGGE